MKITMLGASGSGKTVYMSAMSELFFNGQVDGYVLANRSNKYESSAFIFKGFDQINTLYSNGKFPGGTISTLIMPLVLNYRGQKILDIDWIDYRGGALKELANGTANPQNTELFAALIASDVVLVFVDATVLKVCDNNITARSIVGANEISQILSLVSYKKHIDVMFLLSKSDSDIINVKTDYPFLKARVDSIYSRFFTETNTSIEDYPLITVGAVGCGNIKTSYEWVQDDLNGRILTFRHDIKNFGNMAPMNIAASFANALLKCLDSQENNLNIRASALARELSSLRENFGPVKNLIDVLFNHSGKREHIFDLQSSIHDSRCQIASLQTHRLRLEKIASGPR